MAWYGGGREACASGRVSSLNVKRAPGVEVADKRGRHLKHEIHVCDRGRVWHTETNCEVQLVPGMPCVPWIAAWLQDENSVCSEYMRACTLSRPLCELHA